MKKGYIFVLCFSAFMAAANVIRINLFMKSSPDSINVSLLNFFAMFILFLLPFWVLVRWYYKNKT